MCGDVAPLSNVAVAFQHKLHVKSARPTQSFPTHTDTHTHLCILVDSESLTNAALSRYHKSLSTIVAHLVDMEHNQVRTLMRQAGRRPTPQQGPHTVASGHVSGASFICA